MTITAKCENNCRWVHYDMGTNVPFKYILHLFNMLSFIIRVIARRLKYLPVIGFSKASVFQGEPPG